MKLVSRAALYEVAVARELIPRRPVLIFADAGEPNLPALFGGAAGCDLVNALGGKLANFRRRQASKDERARLRVDRDRLDP